jgi:hypothetical protein
MMAEWIVEPPSLDLWRLDIRRLGVSPAKNTLDRSTNMPITIHELAL